MRIRKGMNKERKNCTTCDKAWTDYCEREECWKHGYCKWVAELNWDEIEAEGDNEE